MKKHVFLVVFLSFSMAAAEMAPHSTLDKSVQTFFTHDGENDEYRPNSDATITEEEGLVVQTGTKTVSGEEWNVYRVTLEEDGQTTVHFDGSGSFDPDHANETSSGIETYQWKVLFDAPYGDDSFDLDGHTFTQTSASQGAWSYRFQNVTVDDTGTTENQIRIELVVYDSAGKLSERHRMYFVVVPHEFGDGEPEFQLDLSLNGTVITSNAIIVNGSLISGSETGEVYVEMAFFEENFSASAVEKYDLHTQNLWAKTDALNDGNSFSLTLSVVEMYSNISENQYVFIKTYEGGYPDERWATVHWFEITLAACHGLVAPEVAVEAGGEFVLDGDGNCQWAGVWSYDPLTGGWEEPELQYDATFSLDIPVEAEVMEVDFFFINGTILASTHDETYIEVAFGNSSFEESSVNKYNLRLIHQWNRSEGLSIQNNFSLGLSVESLRGNITMAYDVHVRAFVYDDDLIQILTDEDSFEIVVPYLDTDGDGIADDYDAFAGDPNETLDSDGDGVGDNSDFYPNDPSFWEEVDDEGGDLNESVPGFEPWLLLFALLLAARFQRKLAC